MQQTLWISWFCVFSVKCLKSFVCCTVVTTCSYHGWADESDGVRETAHNHLSSLRLKLSRTDRQVLCFSSNWFSKLIENQIIYVFAVCENRRKQCWSVDCWTFFLFASWAAWLSVHHVVPNALGQLFVTLYSEVETVVSEEAHIDLPVLLGQTSVDKCFFTQTNKKKLQLEQSIDSQFSCYCTVFHNDSSPNTCWLWGGVPAGGEGRRASERAEGQQQSHPWRNGHCTAAPRVSPEGRNDTKKQSVCSFICAEINR